MRRALSWGGLGVTLLACTVGAAVAVQRLYTDREYRRLLSAGDHALSAGDTYGAVEAFSGALAFRPDSMVAFLRRGQAYRDQRRFDEARRDWRQAGRLAPEAPQPLIALGDLSDALGQPTEAAEWYGQAADRLKGEDANLLYRLALARFKAGAPALAIAPLKAALAKDESSAEGRYLLGLVYRDIGDLPAAIASLESAVALAPDLTAAREELADVYRAQGRPVDEMVQLQALTARDPQVGRRIAIGEAEARSGELGGALGTLATALKTAPNDSSVLLAIGRVHLARAERTGDESGENVLRALDVIEQALGGTAPRSEGLALYGRALFLAERSVEAERILRDAVATSPVDPEAFLFLADAAERAGHDLVARDALVNLGALQGDTVTAEVRAARAGRIGDLSLRAGDPKVAAEYLTRAVDGGHNAPIVLARLAHARWLTGDQGSARDLIAKALAANPRDAQIQRIARVVK